MPPPGIKGRVTATHTGDHPPRRRGTSAHTSIAAISKVQQQQPCLSAAPAKRRRQDTYVTSFSAAPPGPLPIWQQVAISALNSWADQRQSLRYLRTEQNKLKRELRRHLEEQQKQAEKLTAQQELASGKLGSRLHVFVRRTWDRISDVQRRCMAAHFESRKGRRDANRQEEMLKETEQITRKLVEGMIRDDEATPASSTTKRTGRKRDREVSTEDPCPVETKLSLLNTLQGQRPLREYQRSALQWLIHLYDNQLNGILADEMGLGKTVQTIALMCYYAEFKNDWGPHLVVVPTTVVLNWAAEFRRWAPGLKVITYIGPPKARKWLRSGWMQENAFHVCVTSYNIARLDRSVFRRRPWGFVVLDEAHHIKNFASSKWQALFDLQAEYRLLLTGTPLQNSIMELWSLFHFLLPQATAFKSHEEFREWYSNPIDEMVTGRSSLNEGIVRRLQSMLRPFILRRLKVDVEKQLPSKEEKLVKCTLSRRQRFLYDDFMQLAETRAKVARGGPGGVLGVLLSLRKVCDHPDLFEERPTVSPFVTGIGWHDRIVMPFPGQLCLLQNVFGGRYRFHKTASSVLLLDVVDYNLPAAGHHGITADGEASDELEAAPGKLWDWLDCAEVHVPLLIDPSSPLVGRLPTSAFITASSPLLSSLWPAVTAWQELHERTATSSPHMGGVVKGRRGGARLAGSTAEADGCCTCPTDGPSTPSSWLWQALGSLEHERYATCLRRLKMAARIQEQRQRQAASAISVNLPSSAFFCTDPLGRLWYPWRWCPPLRQRAADMQPLVEKCAFCVPAAVARHGPSLAVTGLVAHLGPFRSPTRTSMAPVLSLTRPFSFCAASAFGREEREDGQRADCFSATNFARELWPLHVRRCFSFPDRRLLIHDCGKFQFLEPVLKQLRREGHRALIFTQFVKMLNLLESFLAMIGMTYLRLDGSTRMELRQAYVDRFNADSRITCMILSTRSGGIGLNLTGADTVIFYDSDWNPTMDLQAQDRCHRIGQTRPVTIYRLVSEHTVEEGILRKSWERKKLNNMVIRGGQFHAMASMEQHPMAEGEGEGDRGLSVDAAYARLVAPVNLRSFFHDLDEDATVSLMEAVEDAEDREAQHNVEAELRNLAREDALDSGAEEESDGEGAQRFVTGEEVHQQASVEAAAMLLEDSKPPLVRRRQSEAKAHLHGPLERYLLQHFPFSHSHVVSQHYEGLCKRFGRSLEDEVPPLEEVLR